MRAQYHFRNSPGGLCAWEVRRLVDLSRDLVPEPVSLSSIGELDEAYWAGGENQKLTCREIVDHARLMLESKLEFPVILSSDGRVMDGMHRICKALLQGLETIDAVRFVRDPEPDHIGVHPDDLSYED
jgi:hypothetical protein